MTLVAEVVWGPDRPWDGAPWHLLTVEELRRVRDTLADSYAAATVNRCLAATRSVIRTARRMGWSKLNEDELAAVPGILGEKPLGGKALAVMDVGALLETCAVDPEPAGRRDGFLIALLYGTGLRIGEALKLRREDVCFDKLRVKGKGMRYRMIPIGMWLRPWFAAWLERLKDPSPQVRLFGTWPQNTIRDMLRRRCDTAKIPPCSPHDFRRTFITELLSQGTDVFVVARLAGHGWLSTTLRYDRRGDGALEEAVDRLKLP